MHHITQKAIVAVLPMCLVLLLLSTQALSGADLKITDGHVVTIEYTLTLSDNSVADTNVGGEPLSYVHGQHQILPHLESELAGMHVGQTKIVKVKAADAYGVYSDKAIVSIGKDQIPPDAKVGSILTSNEGHPARILELNEDKAMLDFNHPLAGQDLIFDVKILGVVRLPSPPNLKNPSP